MNSTFEYKLLDWVLMGVLAGAIGYFMLKLNVSEAVSVAVVATAARAIVAVLCEYWRLEIGNSGLTNGVLRHAENVTDGFVPSVYG